MWRKFFIRLSHYAKKDRSMSTTNDAGYRFLISMVTAFLSVAMSLTPLPAKADDYMMVRKWLQAMDDAAAARVTYEICGWGPIDLLTPLLTAGQHEGFRHLTLDELAKRYDEELRERRRTEAVLTAHGANRLRKKAQNYTSC
jgi:hypothetical protein